MKKLQGQNILSLSTINSQYANGMIEAVDDKGEVYRFPVSTIAQMLNEYEFRIEKKRVYNHLVEAILLDDPKNETR